MVQAIIHLGEREDRILTIVKGKYGLKNKSDAVNLVIEKFEETYLEPEVRPEYLEKLQKLVKQPGKRFSSIEELKKQIERE